jgi:transposase-like protein
MRYSASEKLEIIRLVEESTLPVRRTLEKIGIPHATFYRWYDLYHTGGPEALEDQQPKPDRVWNRIPDDVRERIIRLALDSLRCRRGNWPCASLTPKAILSRRRRSIGYSRPTV